MLGCHKLDGMGKICMPETALHEAWQQADGSRATVETAEGEKYRLLYSGMPGGSKGPDFTSAVLESEDGSETVGDVEIHVHPLDWRNHGHDVDSNYDNVVFHAVGNRSHTSGATVNSYGAEVPEIDISDIERFTPHVKSQIARAKLCHGTDDNWQSWLERAGDERFAIKMRMYSIETERYGPDLALQMGIFECLGYPANREAFRHLAKRLPWPYLARYTARAQHRDNANLDRETRDDHSDFVRSLLEWAAGFGDRPDQADVPRLMGDAPSWSRAAGRPANSPIKRVGAAASLVSLWLRCGGPMRYAMDVIQRAERGSQVRDAFRAYNGEIGAGRAGEIVVNAVLPLIAAWAEKRRDRSLYSKTLRLFANHPSLLANSVSKEAERTLRIRGAGPERITGARQQQGLIHIYKTMLLRPRRTRQIPLGHLVPSV